MKETADSTIEAAEGLLTEGEEADTSMSQLKTKADEALRQSQQAVQECAELIAGMFRSVSHMECFQITLLPRIEELRFKLLYS